MHYIMIDCTCQPGHCSTHLMVHLNYIIEGIPNEDMQMQFLIRPSLSRGSPLKHYNKEEYNSQPGLCGSHLMFHLKS